MSDQFFMVYVIETLFEAEVCSRGKMGQLRTEYQSTKILLKAFILVI